MILQLLLTTYLLLVPFVFSVFTLETFEDPKVWVTVTAASLCLPLISLKTKGSALSFGVCMLLISAVLSTVTSVNPSLSIFGDPKGPMGLVVILSLSVIYLAAREAFATEESRKALWLTLVLGSVPVSVYALVQVASLDPLSWSGTISEFGIMRPISTLGHPIALAGYLVMLFPFAVYFAFQNALASLVLIVMVPANIVTQSRGCWVALVVQTIVLVAGSWRREGRRVALMIGVAWLAVIVVVAGLTWAFAPGLAYSIGKRVLIVARPGGARAFYWWAAFETYLRHPWLGVGTDAFRHAFEHLRTADYWGFEWAGTVGKAHNDFLNQLATQGAVGGAAFIYLMLTLFGNARERMRDSRDRAFALTVFTSIVGYYVQNLSGFPTVTTGALFMTAAACLNPVEPKHGTAAVVMRRAAVAAAALVGVMLFYNFAAKPYKASSCAAAATRSHADPGTALRMLDFAARLSPRDPIYPDLIGQVADQAGLWDVAARGYARALELDPQDARYLFKLGTLTGDIQKIELAQLIEPANPVFDHVRKEMQLNQQP